MKNIFIILSRDPRSAQILMFLINSLLRKNYHIHLFCHESKTSTDTYKKIKFINENIKIHTLKIGNSNKFNFIKRAIHIIKELKKIKPIHIIAVDKKSFLIVPILNLFNKKFKKTHMILDFENPSNESFKESIITKIQFFFSKNVDFFLFPSAERAKKFFEFSKIYNKKFSVLSNHFPINFKPEIGNELDKILKEKKISYSKIICSLGTIGDDHYLHELIKSVVDWKNDKILIIGGWPNKNIKEILTKIIIENNLQNKVLILSHISEKLWYEILFKSHLGICFYKQNSFSNRYMAGPSTKLNNYLLANIPFLACDNQDFRDFNSKFNLCELVDPSEPKNISKKINALLNDPDKYNLLKRNSKNAFLKNLNFDMQFKNMLSELMNLEKNYNSLD